MSDSPNDSPNEKAARILPLPEMLDGNDWDVRESGDPKLAYVDFAKMEMVIPSGASKLEEFVRAHEAMHVKITPRGLTREVTKDLPNRMIQACEDARVNAALRVAGIECVQTIADEEILSAAISPVFTEEEAAGFAMAYRDTGSYPAFKKVIGERYPGLLEKVEEIHEAFFGSQEKLRKVPPFQSTLDASEAVWELVQRLEDPPPPPPSNSGGKPKEGGRSEEAPEDGSGSSESDSETQEEEGEGSSKGESEGEAEGEGEKSDDLSEDEGSGESSSTDEQEDARVKQEDSKGEEKESRRLDNVQEDFAKSDKSPVRVNSDKLPAISKSEEKELKKAGIKLPKNWDARDSSGPGQLEIERPPLSRPFKTKKNLRNSSSDSGAIPRSIHRYPTDQRIFKTKQWKYGGAAVLIDVSQSMYLSEEDVDFVLEECPSAIVAIYSGHRSGGKLRVIAEHKSRIDPDSLKGLDDRFRRGSENRYQRGLGRDNVVDLPALEWLAARKEGRKIWVSDGVVTGIGDRGLSPKYLRKMSRLIHSAKIIRVNHLPDLKKSHLLRYDPREGVEYQAPPQWVMTSSLGAGDLNGPGCPVCSDPNCSAWASAKRTAIRRVASGEIKIFPTKDDLFRRS